MYRFALSPRWLLSHLLVLTLVVAMIGLGWWQIQRLEDKRDRNDRITSRIDLPVVPVAELAAGLDLASGADVEYRLASAEGTYRVGDEVLVRNRTLDGAPGYWVLTPLELADGDLVVVNRGWIPISLGDAADRTRSAPPGGPVRIVGLVRATEVRRGIQTADPAGGVLTELSRVDLARLARQIDGELLPVHLQLEEQSPPQQPLDGSTALPIALARPSLDEGPHLGYAVQWFIFTAIAIGGYPLVLRKVARDRAIERDERRITSRP